MRDPQRIDAMVEALRDVWKRHPDQRLCQLVVNASRTNDPFYVEDDEMALFLRDYPEFPPELEADG